MSQAWGFYCRLLSAEQQYTRQALTAAQTRHASSTMSFEELYFMLRDFRVVPELLDKQQLEWIYLRLSWSWKKDGLEPTKAGAGAAHAALAADGLTFSGLCEALARVSLFVVHSEESQERLREHLARFPREHFPCSPALAAVYALVSYMQLHDSVAVQQHIKVRGQETKDFITSSCGNLELQDARLGAVPVGESTLRARWRGRAHRVTMRQQAAAEKQKILGLAKLDQTEQMLLKSMVSTGRWPEAQVEDAIAQRESTLKHASKGDLRRRAPPKPFTVAAGPVTLVEAMQRVSQGHGHPRSAGMRGLRFARPSTAPSKAPYSSSLRLLRSGQQGKGPGRAPRKHAARSAAQGDSLASVAQELIPGSADLPLTSALAGAFRSQQRQRIRMPGALSMGTGGSDRPARTSGVSVLMRRLDPEDACLELYSDNLRAELEALGAAVPDHTGRVSVQGRPFPRSPAEGGDAAASAAQSVERHSTHGGDGSSTAHQRNSASPRSSTHQITLGLDMPAWRALPTLCFACGQVGAGIPCRYKLAITNISSVLVQFEAQWSGPPCVALKFASRPIAPGLREDVDILLRSTAPGAVSGHIHITARCCRGEGTVQRVRVPLRATVTSPFSLQYQWQVMHHKLTPSPQAAAQLSVFPGQANTSWGNAGRRAVDVPPPFSSAGSPLHPVSARAAALVAQQGEPGADPQTRVHGEDSSVLRPGVLSLQQRVEAMQASASAKQRIVGQLRSHALQQSSALHGLGVAGSLFRSMEATAPDGILSGHHAGTSLQRRLHSLHASRPRSAAPLRSIGALGKAL